MFDERADTLNEVKDLIKEARRSLEAARVMASTAEAHGIMRRLTMHLVKIDDLTQHVTSAQGRLRRREEKQNGD